MNRRDVPSGRAARALIFACGRPVALVACGLWLAFLAGFLGPRAWLFELFANFRVQYMALFAMCAVALGIARWRRMAFVAFLGLVATTASMAPYFREPPAHDPARASFKLVTFNVWMRNESLEKTAEFLERSRADAIVLQEVDMAQVDRLARALRSYPHHVVTPNVYYGLAIFSRTPLFEVEHLALPRRVTRITRVKTRWHETDMVIIGAHLSWPMSPTPARQRAAELEMIAQRARRETGPVLVAGDFNLTPWSRYFMRFVSTSGLADCALGYGVRGSWPSQMPLVRIRIDHCFASVHWQVRSIELGPRLGSDHLPVSIELELPEGSRHSSRTTRLMM